MAENKLVSLQKVLDTDKTLFTAMGRTLQLLRASSAVNSRERGTGEGILVPLFAA